MIERPETPSPWLRFGLFVALTAVILFGWGIVLYFVGLAFPEVARAMQLEGPLPFTRLRLAEETTYLVGSLPIFAAMALSLLTAAVVTYRLPAVAFLWPFRRFNGWDLLVGFVAMACLSVILFPVHLAMGSEWAPPILDPLYPDWSRILYLVVGGLALLGAAAAEEVMFRGVLLRLLTQLTQRPLVLCLINGALFSALHMDPDPVANVARTLSGALWCWAAIRLGGLEFAIGAHTANNLMIGLFWSPISSAMERTKADWIDLAPEVFVAVVMVIVIERLADGPRDWRPARLAPRGAA